MRHRSRTIVLAVTCAALAAPAGASAHDAASHAAAGGTSKADKKQLAKARKATAKYKDVDRAQAAGYNPAGPCVSVPGMGGMGVHYVKPALAKSAKVEAKKPEALLFDPQATGKPKLVGVEYIKADADGDIATDDDRPELFGQEFDGPVAGRGPGDPVHYELHVWLHKKNPSGLFAPFNPKVTC